MIGPLYDFAHGGRSAPYVAPEIPRRPEKGLCEVFAVQAPGELAAGKRGARAHYVASAAGVVLGGVTHYAARWLCGPGSPAVEFFTSLGTRELCARCAGKRRTAVYRCYSTTGQLLYVGCTGDRVGRVQYHQRNAPWWSEVARTEYQEFEVAGDAWGSEPRIIAAEAPLYNVMYQAVSAA